MNMKRYLLVLLFLVLGSAAFAETIEFPEDELATESVLPIFEKVEAVKNRTVETEKRFEVGFGGGMNLNEALYNPYHLDAMAVYHFDRVNAVNLVGVFFMDGLSTYGEQLKRGEGLNGTSYDPSLAPHPKSLLLANYQFNAYYGKISVTKQTVVNLNLSGYAGIGTIGLDSGNKMALDFGLGQDFFFTKHFGIRADLRMYIYQGPNPASRTLVTGSAKPPASSFGNSTFYNTMLSVVGIFIL